MTPTDEDIQLALRNAGFNPGPIDGVLGEQTQASVLKFQSAMGLSATGQLDHDTMLRLFPPVKRRSLQEMIDAKLMDYVWNFLTSKINWAAGALVVAVVTWLNTKYGFNVPVDVQNWITTLLVTGGGLLIMFLRTFFNKPKVMEGKVVPK